MGGAGELDGGLIVNDCLQDAKELSFPGSHLVTDDKISGKILRCPCL